MDRYGVVCIRVQQRSDFAVAFVMQRDAVFPYAAGFVKRCAAGLGDVPAYSGVIVRHFYMKSM